MSEDLTPPPRFSDRTLTFDDIPPPRTGSSSDSSYTWDDIDSSDSMGSWDHSTAADHDDRSFLDRPIFAPARAIADRIIDEANDLEQNPRQPRKWARAVGATVLTGLMHVGLFFGAYKTLDQADAVQEPGPIEHTIEIDGDSSEIATQESEDVVEYRALYESAEVVTKDSPFEHPSHTETELDSLWQGAVDSGFRGPAYDAYERARIDNSFFEDVQTQIDVMDAEFMTAVQTSSGIKFNIYRSNIGDASGELAVDPAALDVLTSLTLEQAAGMEGTYATDAMRDLLVKSKSGDLDLTITLILNTDETYCITYPDSGTLSSIDEEEPVVTYASDCQASGVTLMAGSGEQSNNMIIALSDSAFKGFANPISDTTLSALFGHEMGHALIGATPLKGDLPQDEEHAQFVDPLHEQIDFVLRQIDPEATSAFINPFREVSETEITPPIEQEAETDSTFDQYIEENAGQLEEQFGPGGGNPDNWTELPPPTTQDKG